MSKIVRPDQRKLDLARIHMLKAELRWDDDTYRDVMGAVCGGIRSAAELDIASRQRFVAHLEACRAREKGQQPARKTVRKPLTPIGRKLWSLWMQAADKGLVRVRKMHALNAWCARQTGVDRVEWMTPEQERLAVESLKAWVERGGDGEPA